MTPKERVGAFLGGQPVDRVPCVPFILNHAARALGVVVSQYNQNAETMADAQIAAFRQYGQDLIMQFTDCNILSEAMGATLHFPEDDVCRLREPALDSAEAVADLEPADPQTDGRLPMMLEAARRLVAALGDEVFVSCITIAPFTTALGVRGTDQFVRDLVRDKELAHRVLQASLESSLRFTDAVLETGALPAVVDPAATGRVIGAKQFAEFALPYITPILDRIAAAGVPSILHICGETEWLWDGMIETGAGAMSIDQVDLAKAVAALGPHTCIIGNVRPAETMLNGTPADVEEEAKACIEIGREAPKGFILATGCETPLNSPPENVMALMDAARRYGAGALD